MFTKKEWTTLLDQTNDKELIRVLKIASSLLESRGYKIQFEDNKPAKQPKPAKDNPFKPTKFGVLLQFPYSPVIDE